RTLSTYDPTARTIADTPNGSPSDSFAAARASSATSPSAESASRSASPRFGPQSRTTCHGNANATTFKSPASPAATASSHHAIEPANESSDESAVTPASPAAQPDTTKTDRSAT